MNNIQIQ